MLKQKHRVLDLGCGWGSLMGYAAETRGVSAVGVTISKRQAIYARERYKHLPLEFRLEDYRDFTADPASFDRIFSLGMFEHVGKKNYSVYFNTARRLLTPDGLFLLHTIVGRVREHGTDPFIHKYIFPGGELPTMAEILEAVEGVFLVEDLHNLGVNYEKTLHAWNEQLQQQRRDLASRIGERSVRMYEFYLQMSEGAFRARALNIVQVVLSPHGVRGGYQSVR